eukprot:m.301706 g.301706  ORF g.301706 m.301706 type:complete len:177 (+) comp22997_c0_seq7:538-1068(+)
MDEWDDIQASSVAALQVVQACHQRLYEDVERALAESLQSHIAALEQWLLAPAPLPEHPGLLDDTFISSLSAPLAKMCLEHNQGLRSMWSIAQAASADTPPMATSEPTSKSGASTALARLKHGRRHKQAKLTSTAGARQTPGPDDANGGTSSRSGRRLRRQRATAATLGSGGEGGCP